MLQVVDRIQSGVVMAISSEFPISWTCMKSILRNPDRFPHTKRLVWPIDTSREKNIRHLLEAIHLSHLEEIELSVVDESNLSTVSRFSEQIMSRIKNKFSRLIVAQNAFPDMQNWIAPVLSKDSAVRSLELMNAVRPELPWSMIWKAENLEELVLDSVKDSIFPIVQAAVGTQKSNIRVLRVEYSAATDIFSILCIKYLKHVSIAAEYKNGHFEMDTLKHCSLESSNINSISLTIESNFAFNELFEHLEKMSDLKHITIEIVDTDSVPSQYDQAAERLLERRNDIQIVLNNNQHVTDLEDKHVTDTAIGLPKLSTHPMKSKI